MDKKQSIAVIGGGIIGICTAIELKNAGFTVSVFDKNPIAEKCTSIGNTGHIGSDIFPLAQKDLILCIPKLIFQKKSPLFIPLKTLHQNISWLSNFAKSAFTETFQNSTNAMRYLSNQAYDDTCNLYQRAGIRDEVKKTGCLFLYKDDKEFKKAIIQWKLKEQMGIDFKVYQENEITKIEPAIKKNKFKYAVFTSHWGKISDPKDVLLKLYDYALKIGVRFNQAEIKQIKPNLDLNSLSLFFNDKTQHYNKVVVASGIGSLAIAKQIKEHLPIAAARGYAITFQNPNFELNQPILIRDKGLSISSLNSGLRIGGLIELTHPNYKVNETLYEHLENWAYEFFTCEKTVVSKWMNSRPSTYDSVPILCESQKIKNLYFATGHGHWGVSFSATSAKIIKNMIAEPNNLPQEYQFFSLKRFN